MPEGSPRAVVGILHGYADHGARYLHVMGALAEHGIGSVALDVRGHGRATGPRGHCVRFEEYLDDAAELARLVSERARGAPTFLFGHGFGGLRRRDERDRGPALLARARPERAALRGGRAGRARQGGGREGRVAVRAAALAADGALGRADDARSGARAYDDDPLVFGKATARWFTELEKAQARTLALAGEIAMPLYVLFGGADPVVKRSGVRAFFEAAGCEDKTFDERPGLYHEPLSEPEWKDVTESVAKWMLARA